MGICAQHSVGQVVFGQARLSVLAAFFFPFLPRSFKPPAPAFLNIALGRRAWELVAAVQMQCEMPPVIRLRVCLTGFSFGRRAFPGDSLVQGKKEEGEAQEPCSWKHGSEGRQDLMTRHL